MWLGLPTLQLIMCSDRFQIRDYMVEFFFQVLFWRRDSKCRYITGHNVLIFYFFLFFSWLHQHITPSSAIEGRGSVGQYPLLLSIHYTHTHTCTHCHVSPRVNLFTCTSVHWSVWKPKLHIFPLASDPCGLTLFLSSIYHILCGRNYVATQLFIFFSFI